MRPLAYLRSAASRFLRPAQVDGEMEEELRAHIALRADDLERSGLARAEAERRARVEFGGAERFKEECREQLGANFLEVLLRDLRFSLRVLRKTPAFTAIAMATLALAIGANAVVFAVMNGLVLKPLDVPQAESLYGIEHGNEHTMYEPYPDYLDLRDRNRSFDNLAGYHIDGVALDTGNSVMTAWTISATMNYFDALRLRPHLGRFFHESDGHGPNSAPYVVLSHGFWHTQFHGDPGVIGRVIRINKYPFTVIGVTPPEFHGTLIFFSPQVFVPILQQEQLEGKYTLDSRGVTPVFQTLGHLKPGVTPQQAIADLNSIGAWLDRTYPKEHGNTTFVLARPNLYGNYLGAPARAFLGGLMLLAGLILIAACANLGMLFAARASDRGRDVALRLALGASRARILRQMLTEAVLISLGGGAAGLWASVLLLRALRAWNPMPKFPINVPVAPDGNVYAVALGLAIFSGLLFGLVPIRQVLRADPYQVVKAGSSGGVGRRLSVRDLLLAVQITICAVLVTSSIVALRGLARSTHADFGFDPAHALLADTDLALSGYRDDRIPEMQRRMIDAVKAIPGVEAVASASDTPLGAGGMTTLVFTDDNVELRAPTAVAKARKFNVSAGYFATARTAIVAGREFTPHDDEHAPSVAIVNRTLARRIFGSAEKAVGGHIKNRLGLRMEIVGVVEDGKYANLAEDPTTALFQPAPQSPWSQTWLIIRSQHSPEQVAPAVRAALRNLDPSLPVFIETWTSQLDFALFPSRVATVALGVLGAIGAVLSLTGIFGLAAYSVSKRMKEIGIRMAVGATGSDVLRASLGRAFKLLAFASAVGLLLGILGAGVLASIVYQATPRDPIVLGGVIVSMLLLGLVATWIPARRALSADPLRLLREE
jgi:predicted permease